MPPAEVESCCWQLPVVLVVLVVVVVVWVFVVRVALELHVSWLTIALGLDGLDGGELPR